MEGLQTNIKNRYDGASNYRSGEKYSSGSSDEADYKPKKRKKIKKKALQVARIIANVQKVGTKKKAEGHVEQPKSRSLAATYAKAGRTPRGRSENFVGGL